MFISHEAIPQVPNAKSMLLIIALCVIVFRRAALRVLLATVIAATVVGAVVLLHGIR